MRYTKKPKYKLSPRKTHIPKEKETTVQDIYKQMLIDKIKKGRKR